MKRKKILKSLLYLVIFGFFAKILSVIAKVITTRAVGVEGMSIFSLTSPIMLLLYTLGQIGLPNTISKLIASNYEKRYKIIISSFIIGTFLNIILFVITNLSAPFIANVLLKNKNTLKTIYALSYLTPLVCLSGILKGYCFGVNKINISSVSQIIEELGRIIFLLLSYNFITLLNPINASCYAILGLIVAEISQILTLVVGNHLTIDTNANLFIKSFKNKENYDFKLILNTSLPITLNRLITSFTYFLEPIIFTFIMTNKNISSNDIAIQYGLLESYAMPILFLPGFFAGAFSTFLLPNMAKLISLNKLKKARNLLVILTFSSLIIGLISASICYLFPEILLDLLYKNSAAKEYVKLLAFPFIIYYIEAPLNSAMFALNLEKKSLLITIISCILRVISLFIFIPKFDVIGVALSTLVEVIIIVILNLFFIIKFFRNN